MPFELVGLQKPHLPRIRVRASSSPPVATQISSDCRVLSQNSGLVVQEVSSMKPCGFVDKIEVSLHTEMQEIRACKRSTLSKIPCHNAPSAIYTNYTRAGKVSLPLNTCIPRAFWDANTKANASQLIPVRSFQTLLSIKKAELIQLVLLLWAFCFSISLHTHDYRFKP